MCSRFSITSPSEAVRGYFGYHNKADFPPRYNIAPTDPVPVVRLDPHGVRELVLMRWGFIPGWVKDPRQFSTLINARSETAHEKPSFRHAMRRRRCLVPTDGYYEWAGTKGHKRAYFIHPRDDGPLAFAALWEHWQGDEGSEVESVALLTCDANETLSGVHDRMPVFIGPDDFDLWLDCSDEDTDRVRRLLRPSAEDLLDVVEISTRVNNPKNDDADLQKPLQGEMF